MERKRNPDYNIIICKQQEVKQVIQTEVRVDGHNYYRVVALIILRIRKNLEL